MIGTLRLILTLLACARGWRELAFVPIAVELALGFLVGKAIDAGVAQSLREAICVALGISLGCKAWLLMMCVHSPASLRGSIAAPSDEAARAAA
jgi:hypothetical protein